VKPIERLVDADPVWLNDGGRQGTGIAFECPIHADGCYIGVPFTNPLDGGPPSPSDLLPKPVTWDRIGTSFETLTITPSIHVLGKEDGGCEWHGHVRGGRFITLSDSR
jgi:hypothetical protein